MAKRDYYDVLNVSKNATKDEIKKSYRRLAMKFHPDRNTNDADAEKKFKEAKEAYEVLSDNSKKETYDRFGHDGLNQAGARGPGGAEGFSDIFGDVFGDIFGGGRSGGRNQVFRGADLRYELSLDLEKAISGDSIKINIPTQVACNGCSGSGAKEGSSPAKCGTCDGVGQVRMQQGFFSVQQTCPKCQGNGTVIQDPCLKCHGLGRIAKTKTLSVKVPPGVDNGDRIRLSGEGEAGKNGGPSGDLYVEIRVNPHKIFEREGSNISCEIPISILVAALGGEIKMPTLNGSVSVKIPPGTQSGKIFRLKGKGVTTARDKRVGDLYAAISVETPVNLSSKQKDILKDFYLSIEKGGKKHSPRHNSWISSVKNFFDRISS
ncbi:MAG: molecular chaperone DnaJ [Woeseiaceae bacterium]|nr:molecular chaperone DnaJ [Woeseiaceae bacterium]|tara:strand:+ start:2611 stop:3738 length:1128 start_codon:yes stop_codon:yes gene_type:complete